MDYTYHYDSPLGDITLASDGDALTGLWFEGQKHFGYSLGTAHGARELPAFEQTARWLDVYFSGIEPDFAPPLRLVGTSFQNAVWRLLLEIPYGKTTTYGALAKKLFEREGKRTSARSVGGAVGRNLISLIVPCHRVLGASGSLTGYAGGLDRKRVLLELEGVDTAP